MLLDSVSNYVVLHSWIPVLVYPSSNDFDELSEEEFLFQESHL